MSNAPLAVVKIAGILLVVLSLLCWWVASMLYGERINVLQERIQSKDDQIARLEGSLKAQPQSKIEGRQLSKEEEREMVRLLSALKPHGVIVNYEGGDREAHAFAENLAAIFKSIPRWEVSGSNNTSVAGPRETGVFITVSDQGEVPQAVDIVTASLKREGIALSLRKRAPTPQNHLSPRVFEVFVRSQP